MDDPLLWAVIASIVVCTIAGGTILIVRAFRGEAVPTQDPLERIVADLFRSAPSGLGPIYPEIGSSTGRMRTLVGSLATAEAQRVGRNPAPVGVHRASR